MKIIGMVCLAGGLLVAGCGDRFAGEVQKAVGQVQQEASKAAIKTIEGVSTDAVEQLRKMQGAPKKEESPPASPVKPEETSAGK